MDIQLPHKSNGQEADVLRNARQITIIGANGSGKTRFCNWVLQQYPDKAYRISALRALFATSLKPKLKGSIDDIYDKSTRCRPSTRAWRPPSLTGWSTS